jgi:hypothetical protein
MLMRLISACLFGAMLVAAGPLPLKIEGDPAARALWSQTVASPNDDWINDLVALSNGNLVGVGFVNRSEQPDADWAAVAVELRPDGGVVADRRFGMGGGIDAFWSMMDGAGGRRTFAGFTTRIGAGGIDALVAITGPDGAILKEAAHGGPGYDRFTGMTQSGEGLVFVGHSQLPGSDLRRAYLVKTDREGTTMWERIFDGPESWGALYIEPAGDGGFIIAGGVAASGGDADMFVLKTDAEGRELWRKRVGTADWDEINHGIVVRADGTIVLVGYTHAHGTDVNDLVAATLTREGEATRIERWGGAGDDRAILPRLASDGRVWVVGQTASVGAGGSDLLLTSLDANGAFTGRAIVIGGERDDHGTAVLPWDDGSLVVAGYSENLGHGGEDAFIARLSLPRDGPAHPAFRKVVVKPTR